MAVLNLTFDEKMVRSIATAVAEETASVLIEEFDKSVREKGKPERILKRSQVCKEYGISENVLSMLEANGILKSIKIGKFNMYRESWIMQFMDEYRGESLETEQQIKVASALHRKKKSVS